MRLASQRLNTANGGKKGTGTSSVYKGVTWDRNRSKWIAQIMLDGKHHYLGRYVSETEAAHIYDQAAILAWGEFAHPNFPRSKP